MSAKQRVLLVASHGGHWVQLRRIALGFVGLDLCFITTTAGVASDVYPSKVVVVQDANLDKKLKLILLALQVFWGVVRLRPDIVISTGAAPGFFALMFGKMIGAKTIWVDSIANADCLSVSGAKVKPFADLWLTQWEHLAQAEGPFYKGSVL